MRVKWILESNINFVYSLETHLRFDSKYGKHRTEIESFEDTFWLKKKNLIEDWFYPKNNKLIIKVGTKLGINSEGFLPSFLFLPFLPLFPFPSSLFSFFLPYFIRFFFPLSFLSPSFSFTYVCIVQSWEDDYRNDPEIREVPLPYHSQSRVFILFYLYMW